MTVDTDAILKLVTDIIGDKQIQTAAVGSLKGAAMTGISSLIGGVVLGPFGLAVGGTIGGLVAYTQQRGKFKSVNQILDEMSIEQKRRIAYEIHEITRQLDISDLQEFVRLAVIVGTITSANLEDANQLIVQRFIQESVSVVQRHITSA